MKNFGENIEKKTFLEFVWLDGKERKKIVGSRCFFHKPSKSFLFKMERKLRWRNSWNELPKIPLKFTFNSPMCCYCCFFFFFLSFFLPLLLTCWLFFSLNFFSLLLTWWFSFFIYFFLLFFCMNVASFLFFFLFSLTFSGYVAFLFFLFLFFVLICLFSHNFGWFFFFLKTFCYAFFFIL